MAPDIGNFLGAGILTDINFLARVSAGQIPGYSAVHKFARRTGININETHTVWDFLARDDYTYSATANIDSISSSAAGDSGVIEIQGQTLDHVEVLQEVILNGRTAETLTTPLHRVYRMRQVAGAGSDGEIYLTINGAALTGGVPDLATDVRAYIGLNAARSDATRASTFMGVYTIPALHTGFMTGIQSSTTGAARSDVDVTVLQRLTGTAFFREVNVISAAAAGTSSTTQNFPMPEVLPAGTDIEVIATSYGNSNAVDVTFNIVCINDAYLGVNAHQLGSGTVGS